MARPLFQASVLVLFGAALGYLAAQLERPRTAEPAATRGTGAPETSPGLREASPSRAGGAPAATSVAGDSVPPTNPAPLRDRRASTAGGVPELLAALQRAGEGIEDRHLVGGLLLQLSWLDTPAARESLLDMFRRGEHLDGQEGIWSEILEHLDDPAVDGLLAAKVSDLVAAKRYGADGTSIWRAWLRRKGSGASAALVSLLSSRDLDANSVFRAQVLSAIDVPLGDDVRRAVVRELSNPTMAIDAFGALLRTGDAASTEEAFRYLAGNGAYAFRVAERFGPRLNVERAALLREAAQADPRALGTYLEAVSSAPVGVLRAEARPFADSSARALRDLTPALDPYGFGRMAAANSLERSAATLASRDLLDLVLSEIPKSPVGRGELVRAARTMRAVLESRR